MNMKKLLCCALMLCLAVLPVFSLADPLGFGIVNASDLAIRREAGGQRITRLQKGTSVWITGTGKDSKGELWYHVRAQESTKSGWPVREGWVKAEYVDAGESLWNDIRTVRPRPGA